MKTQTFAAVALAAAAMFGMTACGGDDSSNNGAGASQADQDRMEKFANCMKKQGVEVPDAAPGEGGGEMVPVSGSSAEHEAARAACAKYAPSDDANEDITEADQDRVLKKAECLRGQGVNAKDPKPGTLDISVEGSGVSQEKLVEAFSYCNKQVGGEQN
ncbi:hypothetical protein [Streptomyces sp. NL15-2K]|uniref:hypothetical protein n=1 Tax=Streptomyces sp. NL15-2K TaxID=376149 RepID=UPI000F578D19|nr:MULTISPECIES: hypothetical protein [Actinomycetes]WKX06865.1 hypothetical protein Q4V64_04885 [Kutzneria buriramensis]